MFAAQKGHAYIFNALLAKNPNIINAQNNEGWTALMIAAEHGHTGIVNTLLQRGANTNIGNRNGGTAFLIARSKGHNEIENAIFNASHPVVVTPSQPAALPSSYNPRLSRDFFATRTRHDGTPLEISRKIS